MSRYDPDIFILIDFHHIYHWKDNENKHWKDTTAKGRAWIDKNMDVFKLNSVDSSFYEHAANKAGLVVLKA